MLGDQHNKPSAAARNIAGMVLLASSPPAGNGDLVWRTFRRRPLFSIRLTWCESLLQSTALSYTSWHYKQNEVRTDEQTHFASITEWVNHTT